MTTVSTLAVPSLFLDPSDVPRSVHEPIEAETVQQPIHTPYEYKREKRKPKNYKLKTRTPLVTPEGTSKDSSLSKDKAGRTRYRREKTKEFQSRLLYQLLCKEGLDWMNRQVHTLNQSEPSWDELFEHLDEWAGSESYADHTDQICISSSYEIAMGNVDGRGTLSFSKIDRQVKAATDFVLDVWDREYIPMKREQGRRGGLAYRKWSLADYLDTYDMTVTEVSRRLEVSRTTVYAMRKHFEKVFDMSTGEVFNEDGL